MIYSKYAGLLRLTRSLLTEVIDALESADKIGEAVNNKKLIELNARLVVHASQILTLGEVIHVAFWPLVIRDMILGSVPLKILDLAESNQKLGEHIESVGQTEMDLINSACGVDDISKTINTPYSKRGAG